MRDTEPKGETKVKRSEVAKRTIKGMLWCFGIILAGSVANEKLPNYYQIICSISGVALIAILAWWSGAKFGLRR